MHPTLKYLLPILLFGIALSCSQTNSAKQEIIDLIQAKTDLELRENFRILKDSVQHTEGAFDSDYSYSLCIQYEEREERSIIEQINNTLVEGTVEQDEFPVVKRKYSKIAKGIWVEEATGFYFVGATTEALEREPFELKIDTTSNTLNLELTHL